jgi:hypothetical protein
VRRTANTTDPARAVASSLEWSVRAPRQVEEHPADRRGRAQDGREQDALAATDVHQRPDLAEVVGVRDRCGLGFREHRHRVLEDRRLVWVSTDNPLEHRPTSDSHEALSVAATEHRRGLRSSAVAARRRVDARRTLARERRVSEC